MHASSYPQDSAAPQKGARSGVHVPNEVDAELGRRMSNGDEDAFATFYDRFAPGLFSLIYGILRDQKESEDVLQEAFVQMWKRIATYDARRSSLFTWAVMISRHKAIDRLRSRQRQSRLNEAVASETNAVPASGPADRADDALARSDERERVRAALAQLSEGQREAIDLAFFAGLTQTQISERLGAPLGTVKARIRRGLLALREAVGRAFIVNEQLEEQAALYVLGLLEGEEAAAFERRLHSETELRGLVDQLDAAAAAVAHSAPPRDLPPELRDRVLAQVRSGKTVAFPRRSNWIPWAIAACLALTCAYLVAERSGLRKRITRLEQRDILSQIQIASLSSKVESAPDANAVVVWDEKKQRGVLKVTKLPRNAADRDYQLWLVDPQIQGSSRWRRLPRRE